MPVQFQPWILRSIHIAIPINIFKWQMKLLKNNNLNWILYISNTYMRIISKWNAKMLCYFKRLVILNIINVKQCRYNNLLINFIGDTVFRKYLLLNLIFLLFYRFKFDSRPLLDRKLCFRSRVSILLLDLIFFNFFTTSNFAFKFSLDF